MAVFIFILEVHRQLNSEQNWRIWATIYWKRKSQRKRKGVRSQSYKFNHIDGTKRVSLCNFRTRNQKIIPFSPVKQITLTNKILPTKQGFLARNKKMIDSVKARRSVNSIKRKDKPKTKSLRNSQDFNRLYISRKKVNKKMQSLLNQLKTNQI